MPIHLRGEIMESDMGIFSPDGRLLVARTGTQIRSWDTATWTEQGVLPEEKEIRIVRFFFIDSSTLWIGGYDLPARLCDSASLRVRTELEDVRVAIGRSALAGPYASGNS